MEKSKSRFTRLLVGSFMVGSLAWALQAPGALANSNAAAEIELLQKTETQFVSGDARSQYTTQELRCTLYADGSLRVRSGLYLNQGPFRATPLTPERIYSARALSESQVAGLQLLLENISQDGMVEVNLPVALPASRSYFGWVHSMESTRNPLIDLSKEVQGAQSALRLPSLEAQTVIRTLDDLCVLP